VFIKLLAPKLHGRSANPHPLSAGLANDGKHRHEIASEPELLCRNVDLTRPLIALNAIGHAVLWKLRRMERTRQAVDTRFEGRN